MAETGESAGDTIYIIDRIECKPGDGKAMYEHYLENYVPGAKERGMTLVLDSVNPPIWLTDEDSHNTLEFVWSVAGMMGWAAMVGVARMDPEVAPKIIDFWRGVDDRVIARTRTLSAPEADVESLTTPRPPGRIRRHTCSAQCITLRSRRPSPRPTPGPR